MIIIIIVIKVSNTILVEKKKNQLQNKMKMELLSIKTSGDHK